MNQLGKEYMHLASAVQKQSNQVLQQLQRQETRLQRKLAAKDSQAGQALATDISRSYQAVESKLSSVTGAGPSHSAPVLKEYIPGIDSMQTALRFLAIHDLSSLSPAQLQSIKLLNGQLTSLQQALQRANIIQDFVQQRQQQLTSPFQSIELVKELAGIRKTAYYYKSQLDAYKAAVQDPDKLASKVLSAVRDLPAFQHFMQNNSYLSTLFRVPGSTNAVGGTPIAGLQTREQVSSMIAARLGPGASFPGAMETGDGNNANNPLAGGMEQAQRQLNDWKSKISQYGGGSSTAATADFQPNSQHNKTLWHRLVVGLNMQSVQSSAFIPAYSDIALTLGYKINDRSVVGIGAAYKLGWGQPFNHIAFSSQGAGIRSFINWKLRGSIWLSGGYEANYFNAFSNLSQLSNVSSWQRSGLIGLMKTYKAGRKDGSVQLLYDLLSKEHIPRTQPLVFRVGYVL
jgi:hypothetical protein